MSSLITNEERKKAKEVERREKERQEEKEKLETQEKKQRIREVRAAIDSLCRVIDRLKSIEDMNLRCFMLLDKILIASDVSATILLSEEDDGTHDEIADSIGKLQKEIMNIMNWLTTERKIETSNPVPENDGMLSRRRRNRNNNSNNNDTSDV